MNTQLSLPLAVTVHDAYVASHDHTPIAEPANVDRATYQECVYVQYAQELDWTISVMESYDTFTAELLEQWNLLTSIMRVEFCDDDPTPLSASGAPNYRKFLAEVTRTGTLRVYRSTGKHPVLDARTVWHAGRAETINSVFRAVHDFFGHLASGGHFGWTGETQAYYSHAAMFSVKARLALFNETVAQQCYYATVGDFVPEDRAVYFEDYWFNPPIN
jgi:hypothetical protein